MRFTYIGLALLLSLYLCFAVGRSTPSQTPLLLPTASRAMALVCLTACGVAVRHRKIAAALILPVFFVYFAFAFTQQQDHDHLCSFVIKCAAAVGGCLGAAAREDKEEEARDKSVPLPL